MEYLTHGIGIKLNNRSYYSLHVHKKIWTKICLLNTFSSENVSQTYQQFSWYAIYMKMSPKHTKNSHNYDIYAIYIKCLPNIPKFLITMIYAIYITYLFLNEVTLIFFFHIFVSRRRRLTAFRHTWHTDTRCKGLLFILKII